MKTMLLAALAVPFLTGCDVKVDKDAPSDKTIVVPKEEKTVEKNNTTVVAPPKEETKVEKNTTIVNPPAEKKESKTTIVNPPPP